MIVFTCGGTGGDITPAIYLADRLTSPYLFIGGDRIEKQLLKNYHFHEISTSRKNIFKILLGIIEAYKILKKTKASAVFSTGGYVTLPVGIASIFARIPLVLLEQNSVPGRTNSFLARFAQLIFTGYPNMEKYFGKKSIIYSGNPVKTITISNKPKIKRNILLITGGSQGSKKLNLDILTLLPLLKELKLEIVWSTGKHNYESIYQSLKPHVHKNNIIIYEGLNIRLEPYIDDLSNLLPEVKIAISRAGAMSISELIANEIPTIYIPYPYATHNHQYENAKFITDNQAGLLLNETEVQPTIMHMMINTLISGYQNYCNNIKKLNTNSAIDQIVTELSNRGYL